VSLLSNTAASEGIQSLNKNPAFSLQGVHFGHESLARGITQIESMGEAV